MVFDQTPMPDDVLMNKAAIIDRCVNRARKEYGKHRTTFATDHTLQDDAILNIPRACKADLDIGQLLNLRPKLDESQTSYNFFSLFSSAEYILVELAEKLKRIVCVRNTAVYQYLC